MSDHELRRHGDYADMPRGVAWFIISVKEIGLPAVVIGALLYIVFFNQNKVTEAFTTVARALVRLDDGEQAIVENQKLILQRIK